MLFVTGAVVGCAVALVAALLLRRRGRRLLRREALPTTIALLALVLALVALVESTRNRSVTRTVAAPSAAVTAPTPTPSSDTEPPAPRAIVEVPKVLGRTEPDAVSILKNAGLQVSVETLALANVPKNFVISQSPLPQSTAAAGSTVNLIVSAGA